MSKLIYLGHFNTEKNPRVVSPAGQTMMEYLFESINNAGYDLLAVSPAQSRSGEKIEKKEERLSDKTNAIFLPCFKKYHKANFLMRYIQKYRREKNLEKELENILDNGDTLVVYHSLSLIKVIEKLRKKKKFTFVLQVCEVYADVLEDKNLRKKEIEFIRTADKYIFMTELLEKQINNENKPYCVCLGAYKIEKQISKPKEDGKIHILYAGTLDPRKGGADAAILTAEKLDEKYHIHILGFGSDSELIRTKSMIENVKQKTSCGITYDGCLSGKEYTEFLQSCHIGLSTQNPSGAYNATSFPSKILVYLANGLRVVSIRIPAVETSSVGNHMWFYNEYTPNSISKTITSVNLKDEVDGIELVRFLNEDFVKKLRGLL